jgi:hypothetical protein
VIVEGSALQLIEDTFNGGIDEPEVEHISIPEASAKGGAQASA